MRGRYHDVLRSAARRWKGSESRSFADKAASVLSGCHPKQRAFVLDPGRRVAALVPGRGGKTTGGRARIIRRMLLTPRAQCLFGAPTKEHAERLIWAPMKDIFSRLNVRAEFSETKLTCRLPQNGSILHLASLDTKRSIEVQRGVPWHEVGVDECASIDPKVFEFFIQRVVGPRLGDYRGVMWTIGTPNTWNLHGLFYDITRPGSDIGRDWDDREKPEHADWNGWSVHRWTREDGAPFVPEIQNALEEGLIEKKANGWSDQHPVWLTEHCGIWSRDDSEMMFRYRPHKDGSTWNQWDPEKDSRGFAKLPPGEFRYVIGVDLGHADPFAMEVFAFSPHENILYHVFEYIERKMTPTKIAKLFIGDALDADNPKGVVGQIGWPDATVADFAGVGDAILEELRNVHGIPIERADKKNKHAAVELFSGDLVDGRIKILKGSELEKQLSTLQWLYTDWGLKEDKRARNDAADAAIYARMRAFHQFKEEQPEERPARGTSEAADLWAKESEERAAREYLEQFSEMPDFDLLNDDFF